MSSTVFLREFLLPGGPLAAVSPSRHAGVEMHDHDYYELVYIEEGTSLHDLEGRTNLIMSGDLLIIAPGRQHRYIGQTDMRLYNCMFTEQTVHSCGDFAPAELISHLFPSDSGFAQVHLELGERAQIKERLLAIERALKDQGFGWKTAVEAEITLLLLDCSRICGRYAQQGGELKQYVGYAASAMRFIDRHFAEDISVADVAAHVGLSPDYLTRQFKQVTGVAPVTYLRRFRLARAMEYLDDGRSVTDTAALVGFQSLAHFSREFKQELGMSPSQYRKKHLSEPLADLY
ncbi:MAG: helix-turn-helix domain-containing protein [Clostridia bacterium]|nr:helix-turn-helix domain-containing protein [Clostridia bacterium]